ncbi:uncharacterized protein STEHIDRAFT_120813 [Stereum hirsutum FP-91666 SS1]|uniref:uncharacterized protein n=1 Tax=Stereum hirsutum (strain FP-91666) TaxID=721885 RepID=UPI000440C1A8|nr:uncharacterized protein STEHIDRAFT_120813 [Stereum hirsutum FP-91666 SS1]EIM87063.1 hypothetical protein STEHIDRAFT_120813 [Stereum hirsutum FP-91666 SS1]
MNGQERADRGGRIVTNEFRDGAKRMSSIDPKYQCTHPDLSRPNPIIQTTTFGFKSKTESQAQTTTLPANLPALHLL